ncbi:HlyD family type I secretion periplasmic adaptor subunit [Sediminimonas qiaohouensis]|uniref:HlyD family type I secretion periplasmic adaptor subunit n=1 Tax=Sediminimonas qiaohouensis TaxID=552061 RepID=UPI0003FA6B76|nr:HlyD family type I secretion periplasmic adaptor subunit [Sediminimonas qiaohouensis]
MTVTNTQPAPDQRQWFSDVPRSIKRLSIIGILVMLISFGGFGAWAFMAPLAAAVITQGSFVATGNNQIIQHLEGGIIREILVSEGDFVEKGEPIIQLDETAAQAKLREYFLRRARLETITARLLAEYNGDKVFETPEFLHGIPMDSEIEQILTNQRRSFQASKSKLSKEIGLLESTILALRSRKEGYVSQLDALEKQIDLLDEDISAQSQLLEKGLSQRSRLNSLSRAKADGWGQIGQLKAEIAEANALLEKHAGQIEQIIVEHKNAALDELQSAENELDTVRENYSRAREVFQRSTINSPVSGTVVHMNYNTPGGVIESGKPIAEILPSGAPLIIEAKLARTDIDSVKVGQKATIRLVALNQRTTPVLNGTVYYVSADSLKDESEETPQEVYLARVRLSAEEIERVKGFSPTPGMPAQVMIKTAERTFVEYLSKPITDSMARAFREQ